MHPHRGDGVVFDCCLFFVGVDGFLNLNVFDSNYIWCCVRVDVVR